MLFKINIDWYIIVKMEYNKTRPYKKGKSIKGDGI